MLSYFRFSELGPSISIPDPYVNWLCENHHNLNNHQSHPDLPLLQTADVRQSRYARLLDLPTRRRKITPINTQHLRDQLEQAAERSIYKLYSTIYHSEELTQLIASKAHPTETLRQHLIG